MPRIHSTPAALWIILFILERATNDGHEHNDGNTKKRLGHGRLKRYWLSLCQGIAARWLQSDRRLSKNCRRIAPASGRFKLYSVGPASFGQRAASRPASARASPGAALRLVQ